MIDIDLKFYFSLLWRRLPWVLLIWVTLSAAGITVAYILPPVYLSSGTILVVPPQIQGPSAQVPAPQQLQTIRQRLMTRPTLLDMAERLRIFDDQPELSPADRVAAMQDATKFNQITIGQGGRRAPPGAVAFTVSFENADPNLAARVANEMVTLILELNQTIRIELASGTVDFYEQEVSRLQNELTDLEQQLANFKMENAGTLPSTLPLRIQQVNGLKGQIDQLEIQKIGIADQRDQLIKAMNDPAAMAALGGQQALSPEQQQLNALKVQLAQNSVLSANHPTVISLKAQIAALEEIISSGASTTGTAVPVTSPMQVQVDQLNLQIQRLTERQDNMRAQMAELDASIAATPDVEIQLNVLTRNMNSLQAQLANATTSLNAARRGETIEVRQKGETFELIEQANVPDTPESPNRLIIALGGIVAGLGAGLGLVVLLELLNKSIRRPVELTKKLGIQPFATIPYIATRGEVIRGRLKTLAGVAAVAAAVPAALYIVHYQIIPIDLLFTNVMERFGLDGLIASLG